MLLTISTTARPATDLGYLLHKHPAKVQSVELAFGKAHVFYPEASEERCTAALLLDVDPVGLVRGKGKGDEGPLAAYVNDRPYVCSSFLSVAIARTFASALGGRCKERPELPALPMPLAARLAVLPVRGGAALVERIFGPLGYDIDARCHPLDPELGYGEGPYFTVELRSERTLQDLLSHLYVLVPVLDDDKHYYVGREEMEKLLAHGEGWLASHPERELIARRYLKHRRALAREVLERLLSPDEGPDPDARAQAHAEEEAALEAKLSLAEERMGSVLSRSPTRSCSSSPCARRRRTTLPPGRSSSQGRRRRGSTPSNPTTTSSTWRTSWASAASRPGWRAP